MVVRTKPIMVVFELGCQVRRRLRILCGSHSDIPMVVVGPLQHGLAARRYDHQRRVASDLSAWQG